MLNYDVNDFQPKYGDLVHSEPHPHGHFLPHHPHHPHHRPPYTMTEDMELTLKMARDTISRLLSFEERVKCDINNLSKQLTSDNVIFKNAMHEAWTTFLMEVKNEVNVFEGNINAEIQNFKDEVNTNYANLSESVNTKIADLERRYEAEMSELTQNIQNQYEEFKNAVNSRIDNYYETLEQSFADYQQKLTTEINMFEATVNNAIKEFKESQTESFETFRDDLTATVDARLNAQDAKLDDADMYMRTNLTATITTLIGDMKTNGEFTEIIEGEVFNDLQKKVDGFNRISVLYFDCVGDGETDSTAGLKWALSCGKNIFIPEGVFITNEPLYVNVNTCSVIGIGSRSVIKAGENFPDGEAVVTFYSPDGDYYDRERRIKEHGLFSVIGNDRKCDGVRFGGAVGSVYEGHVEGSLFKLIHVRDCDKAFVWGSHVYRNTLLNCDSHSNNYSLYTTDDITDSGEVFTCINCGFWSGALHLVDCSEIMMFGCTIHTKASQNFDGVTVGHLFKDVTANLQNCHIEAIMNTPDECNAKRPPQFYTNNAMLNMKDCYAVVSGDHLTLDTVMFKDVSSNGYGHGIFISGGQWKYYLGRLKTNQLTSGHVEFSNVPLKYMYDGVTLNYKLYDHTKILTTNRKGTFDEAFNISVDDVDVTESTLSNGNKKFTVTPKDYISKTDIGLYRKIDVSKYKTCKMLGKIIHGDGLKSTLTHQNTTPSILMFTDMYDNFINWGDPHNVNLFTDGQTLNIEGRFVAIPPNAKYAYIGFDMRRNGGFIGGTAYNIETNMTFEFM